MSYSADLEMVGDVPEAVGVPRVIERAHVALNHGLVIGKLLGIPVEQTLRVLNTVSSREESILTESEMQELQASYSAVRSALDVAITHDGLATASPAGDALRASDLLVADAAGVLAVRHPRMPLRELSARLAEIDRVLCHALAYHGALRLEPT
jgi:hypothetical protein